MKGDPVIAYGQLRTNEYTTREGVERSGVEMTASAVGPDLARCIVKVERARAAASTTSDERSDGTRAEDGREEDTEGEGERTEAAFDGHEAAESEVEERDAVGAGV